MPNISLVIIYRVKLSSNLRTSNFKFEFIFVFQPFDIQIQASLIRCRRFCLESGALLLQRCTVWWFLCSLLAINSSNACRSLYSRQRVRWVWPDDITCITIDIWYSTHVYSQQHVRLHTYANKILLFTYQKANYSSSSLPSLHTAVVFNYSLSCTAPLARVVYWCKLSKWQILVAQTQSRHQTQIIA